MKFKTIVTNWQYHDGYYTRYTFGKEVKEYFPESVGWHCWVYPDDDLNLDDWMEKHMKGSYDCTFRFNSGDPMYTVFIKEDEDATAFKLKWL